MKIRYEVHCSRYLQRQMEYKVYGRGGLVCIALPPEGGRFYDCEERGLLAGASRWLEDGRMTVFCPDSIDAETFLASGSERPRIEQHERWICYLLQEFLPLVQDACPNAFPVPLLIGCGLGANHAVNLYLRHPALFQGVIGLSGLYDTGRFFSDTADDLIYRSSPLPILAALPQGSEKLRLYQKAAPLVLCCGKGPGQEQTALQDTRTLADLLHKQQVPVWCDEWGEDVTHDWHWWSRQLDYFLEKAVFAASSSTL